jgi:DNA-binding beta-propeller fold protein YncE
MKKMLVVLLALSLFSGAAIAGKWQFKEAVIVGRPEGTDAGAAGVNLWGFRLPYGVAVDPDGKIWTASYSQRSYYAADGTTLIWPDDLITPTDTIGTYPIFIKKTDGKFDSLMFLNYPDGSVDTLTGSCRGMVVAPDGNIIYARNTRTGFNLSSIYKINYQTYEVIKRYDIDDAAINITRPAVDENGYVYFTTLYGGTVTILDPDDWSTPYNTITDVTPSVCRSMEVSPDGKHVYVASYNGGALHYYSENGVDGTYAPADTILKRFNGVVVEGNLVQWDPAGLLWLGTREEAALKIMWALDPANNYAIVDSISFTWWGNTDKKDTTTGNDPKRGYAQPKYLRAPRDAAFSPDGKTMYIADYYAYTLKAFEYVETAVESDESMIVPDEFQLSQNYPNPFNAATKIKYSVGKQGITTLKIYDMLGREVATLVNEALPIGSYYIEFDASQLPSGTYVYELKSGNITLTKKMTLMK